MISSERFLRWKVNDDHKGNFRKGEHLEWLFAQAAHDTGQSIYFGVASYDPDDFFGLYSGESDLSAFWQRVRELEEEPCTHL